MRVEGGQHVRVSPQSIDCGYEVVPSAIWIKEHELIINTERLGSVAELADADLSLGWKHFLHIILAQVGILDLHEVVPLLNFFEGFPLFLNQS